MIVVGVASRKLGYGTVFSFEVGERARFLIY